jgi:hypothetical protein
VEEPENRIVAVGLLGDDQKLHDRRA